MLVGKKREREGGTHGSSEVVISLDYYYWANGKRLTVSVSGEPEECPLGKVDVEAGRVDPVGEQQDRLGGAAAAGGGRGRCGWRQGQLV